MACAVHAAKAVPWEFFSVVFEINKCSTHTHTFLQLYKVNFYYYFNIQRLSTLQKH